MIFQISGNLVLRTSRKTKSEIKIISAKASSTNQAPVGNPAIPKKKKAVKKL